MEQHVISLKEFKEFVKELTEVKGKVERVEIHLKKYDISMQDIKEGQEKQNQILQDINVFFNGNGFNGNQGFIKEFERIKKEQEELRTLKIKHEIYFALMGAFLLLLGGGLATALFKLFLQ